MQSMESELNTMLSSGRSKLFPPLKRGAVIDVYLNSSGNIQIPVSNLHFVLLLHIQHVPYQFFFSYLCTCATLNILLKMSCSNTLPAGPIILKLLIPNFFQIMVYELFWFPILPVLYIFFGNWYFAWNSFFFFYFFLF